MVSPSRSGTVPVMRTPRATVPFLLPRSSLVRVGTLAICALGAPTVGMAGAQQAPRTAVELAAGWVGFADDGVVSETMMGGSGRFYVLPRVAVGPEIVHIRGYSHSHLVWTGNVTFDVLGPSRGRLPRVTPFAGLGGGFFQTRSQFPAGSFSSTEGAFTAGGGLRARVGERVTVGVEARVGWEPHLRVNAVIGWRLGT
jgi:hypothetical protein